MPRQRLKPGEWGKITVTKRDGQIVAKARICDQDGVIRLVERTGTSDENAARNLQKELKSRTRVRRAGQLLSSSKVDALANHWFELRKPDVAAGRLTSQTLSEYEQSWKREGTKRIGSLQIRDVTAGIADAFLADIRSRATARRVQVIGRSMFATAVRLDLIEANPFRETEVKRDKKKRPRSIRPLELDAIRKLVDAYCRHERVLEDGTVKRKLGPAPGQDLPDIIELLVQTGARISEVLALRRHDLNLEGDRPTVTFNGTLVVPRYKGDKLFRQEFRKGDAPPLTVVLPKYVVARLRRRLNEIPPAGPDCDGVDRNPHNALFLTSTGNWMAPANVRRNLRAAIGREDFEFGWLTPHSFRRTVATTVKEKSGVDAAAEQLGNTTLVTELHYVERMTTARDNRDALNVFAPRQN